LKLALIHFRELQRNDLNSNSGGSLVMMKAALARRVRLMGWITGSILCFHGTGMAETDLFLIGTEGNSWVTGPYALESGRAVDTFPPATISADRRRVEQSNTPGDVVDREFPDRINWIFPSSSDTNTSIMNGFDSEARGGQVFTPIPSFRYLTETFKFMTDGSTLTALELTTNTDGASAGARGFILDFDLGAVFGVNRIRFFPRASKQRDFIKGYEVGLNDGTSNMVVGGAKIYTFIESEPANEEIDVDIRFPTQFVRHIRLRSLSPAGFEIAEFEVYTEGFVPTALYVSNVIDFGEKVILGNLRWVGEQFEDAERSRAVIRTRTGDDPNPTQYARVGVQPSGRIEQRGQSFVPIPIDALWKTADDVSDSRLSSLIENQLDDPDLDGRDVLLQFDRLAFDDRQAILLDQATYDETADIREDITDWSPWSPAYPLAAVVAQEQIRDPLAGVLVLSPTPRRYFQFRVEFESSEFDAATGVGAVAVDVVSPVFADSLIAEVFPRQAEVGVERDFSYVVLFKKGGTLERFDRFRVQTPIRTESIGRIEILDADGSVRSEADFTGTSLADADLPAEDTAGTCIDDGQSGQKCFSILESEADGFTIEFPEAITQTNTSLRVQFKSSVLRVGTRYGGQALNTDEPLFGQPVAAGNAFDFGQEDPDAGAIGSLDAGNLFVEVPVVKGLLVNVRAVPAVLTPNNDQRNDVAQITYDITNIARPTGIEIKIFDLSGRLLRIDKIAQSSGRFSWPWDGLDQSGMLVPPGNYIFSVTLNAGTGDESGVGVVSVAY
jgi:hypothetical protein